ncbi:MAG: hypothetical protein M1387_02785 [Thaumarchaeota archaeon]|nr:hypothetical protein [Nitrososphaerota archaeon]
MTVPDKEPGSLAVVPNDRILMQQEAAWYYGGYTSFNRVALGHLIVTERRLLFFEQKPVGLSQFFSDTSIETFSLAFTLPLDAMRSAQVEMRIRGRGGRPDWRDTEMYRKIMLGQRQINQPVGFLGRKNEYQVLIISVNNGEGRVDSLVFEVENPVEWMRVLKREEKRLAAHEEVPKDERVTVETTENRVRIGVARLDELLNGGIPEGYSVLLTSPSCDEKDDLLQQFLGKAIDDGKTAIYVCADSLKVQSTSGTQPKNLYVLACSSRAEVPPQGALNVRSIKGLDNLSDLNIGLMEIIDRVGGGDNGKSGVICIDVLSEILLQHKIRDTRRWLTDILPRLRYKGYTVLATFNLYMHSPEETQAMVDVFDGEISLYDKEGSDAKWIQVKKMFNTGHSRRAIPFDR